MTFRYAPDLAPEEVFNEAGQILARDRAKFSGTNYPVYRGQTISPMSSMTQRARSLQSGFNAKPAPYSGKINQVLSRSNQGINPLAMQGQLNNLGSRQQEFNNSGLLKTLSEQYRESFQPRVDRFGRKTNKDIRSGLNETSGQLQDIGRTSGILEQSSNQAFADRLRKLQAQKQDRRQGLVGTLEQFGAQKHGYNNLANAVNKNSFEQEANAPFRRMDMLQDSLRGLSQNMDPNVLPELQAQSGKDAMQALRAYGIDTSRPVEQWGDSRIPKPSYPGKLMANLPPEILASHSTLESMNPKFRGSQYDQQKDLIRQMMANQSVGDSAMARVPARMEGQIGNLESEAKKRLKKDLAGINNQYIQANQFGSPQHMQSAEGRAREISKAMFEQRSRMLQDTMKSELSLGHQEQQANLSQTGALGSQAQKEYEDMLNAIRSTNNLGATKFANEQNENEDLYKNFQNEAAWEWPHLKNSISKEARQGSYGDIFRGLEDRNISLDNLAALNTKYSESQKDATSARANLQTRDNTIADLQRQLGVFQTQAQTQQQEQQSAAQREVLQQSAQDQARKARDAETQRLAGIKAQTERDSIPAMYRPENWNSQMSDAAREAARLWTIANNTNTPNAGTLSEFVRKNGYRYENGLWIR